MKCGRFERWMLLAGSGELPPRKRARLKSHLATCPRCAAYREDVELILETAGRGLPQADPGPGVLAAVRREARNAASRPRRKTLAAGFPPAMRRRRLVALAAAMLICAAVWHMTARRDAPPDIVVSETSRHILEKELLPAADEVRELTIINWDERTLVERVSDLMLLDDVSPAERELMILDGFAI